MTFYYRFFSFLFSAIIILIFSLRVNAQNLDTLIVEWQGTDEYLVNRLYDAVMGDTLPNGSHVQNRVYKLRRGGYYWNTRTIRNDGWALRIVGETPGNTFETAPPVIQMIISSNGASPGNMFEISGDVTFKNIYFIGSDDLGIQTYSHTIEVEANNLHCIIDNCIFDRSNFSMLAWQGGANNDIYITNCKFRNLIERPSTTQWAGSCISIWKDQDTVVIENNTFFNINFTPLQIENGAARYVRFNHNTLVNIGRNIHSPNGSWWRETYFANLLLVNVNWHGEGNCDYGPTFATGRDPRAYYTGMFSVNTIPSRYGTDWGRRIVFVNAAAYLDNYFKMRYADTIRTQPYTNAVTDSFFTTFSTAKGGQMVIKDTSWLAANPNFTHNPNNESQLAMMYDHITASRGYQYYGTGIQAKPYFYSLPTDPTTGDTLWTLPAWPLPESFSYNDSFLLTKGTDNLPLGDLNWFPDKKKLFETNKAKYVKQIEVLSGGGPEPYMWEYQAESGTLADDARVLPFTGKAWYTLRGNSSISWAFNVASGGPVDMVIKGKLDGTNIGIDFLLNGSEIHDVLGWSEFLFLGDLQLVMNANKWLGLADGQFHEVKYVGTDIKEPGALKLNTGTNTVELKYSWNPISFARIDFYEAGTNNLAASLIPADAVNHDANPSGEGKWIPDEFKYVDLNTNGSITWNLDLQIGSSYLMRVFYQNPGSAQIGNISVDGVQAATLVFNSRPDSTGLDGLSSAFNITEGSHSIKLTGSYVNVDKIQLLPRFVSVSGENEIPQEYTLEQNYPNPFNPTTTIGFQIPVSGHVSLKIFDILGREVAELVNEEKIVGRYEVKFDGSKLASGVYLYRLVSGNKILSNKFVLIK